MFLLLPPVSEATRFLMYLKSPWADDKMILTEERDQTLICPTSMPEYVINGNNMVKGPLLLLYL